MLHDLRREHGFYKRLWTLTLPIALQNLITFSLSLIDTFMVSQLGNNEMAAVTTANVPSFLIINIVFGLQSGLGILVSQYWGKGDLKNITRALGVAAIIGSCMTLFSAVILFLYPVQVMDLLSNNHALSVLGAPYLRIIGFSYLFNMLSSIYAAAQRSAENPSFGMLLFGFSTVLNTLLNYLLIFGHCGLPALGVSGAAIATLLSRLSECLICVVYAVRNKRLPLFLSALFHPGLDMAKRFVKYAWPVVFNEILWGLGTALFTVILGYTDNSVEMLAANAVVGNLNKISLVVCFGLGNATAVLLGKSIGEGKSHQEIMSLSRAMLTFTTLVGAGLSLICLAMMPTVFIPVIFPMFKLYGESAAIATALATVTFIGIPLHACGISAVIGVLRAGGDVTYATILDTAPQWLVAIPLTALTALVWKTGYWSIAIAIQMESIVKMPLCFYRLRNDKWIHDVTRGSDL